MLNKYEVSGIIYTNSYVVPWFIADIDTMQAALWLILRDVLCPITNILERPAITNFQFSCLCSIHWRLGEEGWLHQEHWPCWCCGRGLRVTSRSCSSHTLPYLLYPHHHLLFQPFSHTVAPRRVQWKWEEQRGTSLRIRTRVLFAHREVSTPPIFDDMRLGGCHLSLAIGLSYRALIPIFLSRSCFKGKLIKFIPCKPLYCGAIASRKRQ